MDRVNYTEFEGGFNQVILEESFVLNLKTTMSFVDFQMEFAVNEQYPLYTPPEVSLTPPRRPETETEWTDVEWTEDESEPGVVLDVPAAGSSAETVEETTPAYSYRRGRIFFPNMEQVRWQSRIQPYIDPASGTVDYGAIDYFYLKEGCYYLAGYWGELEVVSGPPLLEIDELKQLSPEQRAALNLSNPQQSKASSS